MSLRPRAGNGRRRRLQVVLVALAVVVAAPAALGRAAEPEWNVARIGGPIPAPGVVVAVVDTGVDSSHPTFGNRILPAIDLVGGPAGDPDGHGTHVAGIAGGGDSGPVIGVAPAVQILPVRVLGPDGSGTLATIDAGIRRATDAGAAVINLSLGDDVLIRNLTGSGLADAVRYAWARGAICVLAAGNDGLLGGLLGSGYRDLPVVVVTATGTDDRIASYATSIGNARWGISAPGGDNTGDARGVLSAWPGGEYLHMAGTSMAAPHVSGALAVLRAHGLAAPQAVDRLLATARPVGSRYTYGAGLVDLKAAVGDLVIGGGDSTTTSASPAPPPTAAPTTAAGPTTSRPPASQASADPSVTETTPLPGSEPTTGPLPPDGDVAAADRPGTGGGDGDVTAPVAMVGVAACALAWLAVARSLRAHQPLQPR
ncbi:MAG: S8 family peptidase [Acidimicrobiales bacterium]